MDFSAEAMHVSGECNGTCKALKEINSQTRILNPAKLSFKNEGKIIICQKNKNGDFDNTKPTLKEVPKEVYQVETKKC